MLNGGGAQMLLRLGLVVGQLLGLKEPQVAAHLEPIKQEVLGECRDLDVSR